MIKYLNGFLNKGFAGGERALYINLSNDDSGQDLQGHLPEIINSYKKHVGCVCFIGKDQDQVELAEYCKIIHKNDIKTAVFFWLDDPSQIIKQLATELDYLRLVKGKTYKKDYCPFGDIIDWIEM